MSGNRPYRSVQAKWLPQLQLHCLGAETQSTLLVSRTATKGVTIFRVFRYDQVYLRITLSAASVLTYLNAHVPSPPWHVTCSLRNDEYIQNLLAVVGHVSRQVQLGRRASQSMFKERQIKSQVRLACHEISYIYFQSFDLALAIGFMRILWLNTSTAVVYCCTC